MNPNRLFCGALLALALVASQTVHADDKTVTLARKYKDGGAIRYESALKGSVSGTEFLIKGNVKQTVKEIKKSGDVVLLREEEAGRAKIGEADETDSMPQPPVTHTRDKRNRLLEYKTEPPAQPIMTPEVARLLASLEDVILPDKPVKEGDTWETEIENAAAKDKKITVKSKFLGTEKVDGKELWKIKQTAGAVANADGTLLTYEVTAWLLPEDGQIQKLEGKLTDVPITFGAASWDVTLKRLADKAKETKTDAPK